MATSLSQMFLRIHSSGARRVAALLLLLGVILGGTIDAAACEPTEQAASLVIFENHSDADKLPGGDHDGVCVHGHCHHVISNMQQSAALGDVPAYHSDHPPGRDQSLASIVTDTLKRPPRA